MCPIPSIKCLVYSPAQSLDSLSSEWAWPRGSTFCRVNGPRRANDLKHIHIDMRTKRLAGLFIQQSTGRVQHSHERVGLEEGVGERTLLIDQV